METASAGAAVAAVGVAAERDGATAASSSASPASPYAMYLIVSNIGKRSNGASRLSRRSPWLDASRCRRRRRV